MPLEYGDVIYNPTGLVVARLQADNSYGTVGVVDYLGDFSFNFESDEDDIMSGGAIVETLSIVKRGTGKLTDAALNWPAIVVMSGLDDPSEEGDTPNRIKTLDVKFGGRGMAYFGAVVRYEAQQGSNLLVGFPKAMLSTLPSFTVEQNKFRTGEANIKMIGVGTTAQGRRGVRMKKYETAAALPSTGEAFDTFFTGMFS